MTFYDAVALRRSGRPFQGGVFDECVAQGNSSGFRDMICHQQIMVTSRVSHRKIICG